MNTLSAENSLVLIIDIQERLVSAQIGRAHV